MEKVNKMCRCCGIIKHKEEMIASERDKLISLCQECGDGFSATTLHRLSQYDD